MLVDAAPIGRSPAGFESLCFEPENEDDCKAVDTLLNAIRLMVDLTFVDDEQTGQPPALKRGKTS